MKKVILSIALVAFLGLGLTSCDKDERKCYKFTYEVEILGAKTEVSTYEWCSANEADKSHKTAEDCIAANIEK